MCCNKKQKVILILSRVPDITTLIYGRCFYSRDACLPVDIPRINRRGKSGKGVGKKLLFATINTRP